MDLCFEPHAAHQFWDILFGQDRVAGPTSELANEECDVLTHSNNFQSEWSIANLFNELRPFNILDLLIRVNGDVRCE